MTAHAATLRSWIPNTAPAPGTPLWGDAPRKQPIVPLIALALITLLVAAPAALSSDGRSRNPIVLMHQVAASTYDITGLMQDANNLLSRINDNARPLRQLSASMAGIKSSTEGMADKTTRLSTTLADVGDSVSTSRSQLSVVNGKLSNTASQMGTLSTTVNGSLDSTKQVVSEFSRIDSAITQMDAGLKTAITLMAQSEPQTRQFATNRTRIAVAGGDGTRYGAPNIAAGSSVMSVVLPMITTMQRGGPIVVRKDGAQASNPLVGAILNRQIPDGTNVVLNAIPFDGFYGLPSQQWFVTHRVNGF